MSWPSTRVFTDSVVVRRPERLKIQMAKPVTNMARVASMNGAPRMAPTPTASPWPPAPPPNTTATIGISVSGMAVPTAAKTLPTTPSLTFSFSPSHSTALVNSSAQMRMIARLTMSRTIVNVIRDPP
jgi:hypothetical protein